MRAVIAIIMLCVVFIGIGVIRETVPVPGAVSARTPPLAPRAEPTLIPVAAQRDDTIARQYAVTFATGYEAERNCLGVSFNRTSLMLLRTDAKLEDGDDDWLRAQFNDIKPDIERAILKEGAKAWCEAAWIAHGPNGTKLLYRP